MGRVSRWAVRRPVLAIVAWLAAVLVVFGAAGAFGGQYNDTFTLPDTESARATEVLTDEFGGFGARTTVDIVYSPTTGTVDDAAVKAAYAEIKADVEQLESVDAVIDPYGDDPQAQGAISEDRTVARSTVTFTGAQDEIPTADIIALKGIIEEAGTDTLEVGGSGQVLDFVGGEPPSSEAIGIAVAIVLLILTFGSLVAAGLPILTALLGLGTGLALVTVGAKFLDIATFGPTLAAMIGLGVGIDYALFVINRHRQAVLAGRDPKDAAYETVATAGRAVVFAGTTVIIALLGLFVLNIDFMDGLAVAASLTVLTVMLTAVTLLPAVISLLGRRTYSLRMPWARGEAHPEGRAFARHALNVQRHPWAWGLGALAIVLALSFPVLDIRQGFPDAGGKKPGDIQRTAYDLISEGFGPGANGPFIVVAELPEGGDLTLTDALVEGLQGDPGVAFASPANPSESGAAALIQVQPTTGPQDAETAELLDRLRADVIPPAVAGTGVVASVGGSTAVIADFGQVLTDALPLLLTVVVGLGFLALVLLFRSILVPLIGAATSLLSLGAALGATVAVFQWGHLNDLLGVTATGPILPFLPVMLFAILFGLSMDYQVFLVSRMQEEWMRTSDNRASVRRGLAGSGRVVAVAAAIMASVFLAFVAGDDTTIKMFGLALGIAVLVDAFIIRLIFVPALMTVIGPNSWWLPAWLGRVLPAVHIEAEELEAEAAEIADVDPAELTGRR